MKPWRFWLPCLLATALAAPGLVATALADGPPHPAAALPVEAEGVAPSVIDGFVRDLASPDFSLRELATRRLTALGIVTRDALERAAVDPDAEVRTRARAILGEIRQQDFEDRLEAFLADYDGSRQLTLPAWEPFSLLFGGGRLTRELFVEMQRAEPELLEALAAGGATATLALAERSQQILAGQRETLASVGTLAALLYVGTSDGVTVDEQAGINLLPYVVQSTHQRTGRTPLWSGVLKRLVARWIAKDTNEVTVNQNMLFAAQLDLKDEALALARRQLADAENAVQSRQMAILLVAHFGDGSHLPLLERLLDDTTSCGLVPTEKPPHQIELQIRDVALAGLIYLTRQNLSAYGFLSARNYVPPVLAIGPLAFGDPQSREKALKKWAQWRADHPGS